METKEALITNENYQYYEHEKNNHSSSSNQCPFRKGLETLDYSRAQY